MAELAGKRIVLGVTGGIAAYKAAMLASALVQRGAHVEVILTQAAQRFIQPLTFSAITHAPVHQDLFAPWHTDFSGHVTVAEQADLLLIAPATASTIARLALGLSDDLLSLVALSTPAPLMLAPAMEHRMLHHPATQQHLQCLQERGAFIVSPTTGRLASGASGDGRMAEPDAIVAAVSSLLVGSGSLRGRTVVVTAGGTREPIDPVRYIGNRSSGQMGYAIAAAALVQGASVTLISGPVTLAPPAGVSMVHVETAQQMETAVHAAIHDADVLIMAAAVADFRAAAPADQKIKKDANTETLDLHLVRNPDILAGVQRPGLLKIGFAAETEDLLANAARKVVSKGLDMIVANDATATIGAADSTATLLFADGRVEPLPRLAKGEVANRIVSAIRDLLVARDSDSS